MSKSELKTIRGLVSYGLVLISLKKELDLVTEISAFITGSLDDGLFIISGKLAEGISFEELDKQLWLELDKIKQTGVETEKLIGIKNKISTAKAFQEQGLLNRSINLSFFELLGDSNGINEEPLIYQKIETNDLILFAKNTFVKTNCSLLKVCNNA